MFRAREGVEVVGGRETPPSHNLSKGGGSGGVPTEETSPPSCVFQAREGVVVCRWKEHSLHLTF